MSLQAWQLEAQKKFKEFKRAQKLIGEQIDFNYTVNTYEEHWNLTPIGSADDVPFDRYRLFAGRHFVKVELPDNKVISLLPVSTENMRPDEKENIAYDDSGILYTIEQCARCGQNHPVKFKPFTIPPEGYYEIKRGKIKEVNIKWWGTCPTNGEPILMEQH